MNYKALVEDYRERLIDDLMGLLEIKSVKGEPTGSAPVGADRRRHWTTCWNSAPVTAWP